MFVCVSVCTYLHSCEIQWNKGKNVTMKTMKKTQKHKCMRSDCRTMMWVGVLEYVRMSVCVSVFYPLSPGKDQGCYEDGEAGFFLSIL